MRTTIATQDVLLPRPQSVVRHRGTFDARRPVRLAITPAARSLTSAAATILRSIVRRDGVDATRETARLILDLATPKSAPPQSYTLSIRPDEIRIAASDVPGFRYAAVTLAQLLHCGAKAVAAMDIDDRPDIAARGVMLDISRDKVPTLATIKQLVDRLAGWKINQIQLYTEHTFAYRGHEKVWRGASPMTPTQIETLDRYCRDRCVELVPNQNSFGHMEKWLQHKPYIAMAEMDGPWIDPWGKQREHPSTLNPLDPASIRFVGSLYDQLLPHFSSRLFNVGCDETFELGKGRSKAACQRRGPGRVYLDFLLKIRREVRRHDRRMMFWDDIAMQHPELLPRLPKDVMLAVWGYDTGHPFDQYCERLVQHGLDFYVCPGTSSWCSFGGRSRNCVANLAEAAAAGLRHKASGYLITDWGDYGHRQYQPASYLGFLYGAAVSWCHKTNEPLNAAKELSRHAFGDSNGQAGRLWFDIGRVHEAAKHPLKNRTILFSVMQTPLDDPHVCEHLTSARVQAMHAAASRIAAQATRAPFAGADADLVRDELIVTAHVLRHACERANVMLSLPSGKPIRRACRKLAADMRKIIDRHARLWRARNRPGGLNASLSHYRNMLNEYERLS